MIAAEARSDDRIYVLLPAADYEACRASGFYRPAAMKDEGFIHASPANQVARVADKYYAGRKDVMVLHIDPALVRAEIRWEPAAGSLYPHIYGPLNLDAVVEVTGIDLLLAKPAIMGIE